MTQGHVPALVFAMGLASCSAAEPPADTRSALREGRQGGVAAIDMGVALDTVDPAFMYSTQSWRIEYATCAKLLNYRAVDGQVVLVPEIAARLPRVSSDGRTYTFQIRDSFVFSPPSNERVTASSMKATIERVLSLSESPGAFFLDQVESVAVAGGDQLIITLREPQPDFRHRIAMPFYCAVPSSTPLHLTAPPPMAGPYYFADYQAGASLVLERNPNYDGPRRGSLDEMRFTIGRPAPQSIGLIEAGEVDYLMGMVPPALADDLDARFGADSPAAADGRQQYFVNPMLGYWYLAMNTTRPWFSRPKMRQAVSFAIDRAALAAAFKLEPFAKYLPEALPSAPAESIYPLDGPDVDRARDLIAEAGGVDQTGPAVLWTFDNPIGLALADIVQANLQAAGISVQIQHFPRPVQNALASVLGAPFDITIEGWAADYPDPAAFLDVLLDGDGIRADGNTNLAYFDDPSFNDLLDAATVLDGAAREAAYRDAALRAARDHAPLAVFASLGARDFFSSKIGCQSFNPLYGMDLTKLCLRR